MPPAATTILELAANHPETIGERLSEQARLIPHKVLLVTGERAVPYPLYHVDANFAAYLSSLHRGGKAVVLSRFSASRFWNEIREHGVTHTIFMGAVATFLFNRPEQPDDADNLLRLVMTAPMPAFWRDFERRFGLKLVSAFGATELNMVSWADLDAHNIDDTAGTPGEHFELRIGDEHDEALPVGMAGEILLRPRRAYTMMTSYYKNPAATAETWRNLWHHTGDRGYLDEAGDLHFLGRKKDSIRRRGENISAFEVEEVLDSHAEVVESAVIGVALGIHRRRGQGSARVTLIGCLYPSGDCRLGQRQTAPLRVAALR